MVVVIGASGWIGRNICATLHRGGVSHRGLTSRSQVDPNVYTVTNQAELEEHIRQAEVVIYAASDHKSNWKIRRHIFHIKNVVAILKKLNVRRFIYLSTIKVYGESASVHNPYLTTSPISPRSRYARFKAEAEGTIRTSISNQVECLVIRFPVVVGLGARGFLGLVSRLSSYGLNLPIVDCDNYRSYVLMETLVRRVIDYAARGYSKSTFEVIHISEPTAVSSKRLLEIQTGISGTPVKFQVLTGLSAILFKYSILRLPPLSRFVKSLVVN